MSSSGNGTSYYTAVEVSRTTLLVIIPIITIMTMVANGVYIITLAKTRTLHTPSNMLLGALAVSDLLVGIIADPIWMFWISNNLEIKSTAVKLCGAMMFFFILVSFLNIAAVSVDRYIAIFHPFWYHASATYKTHLKIATVVLFISILIFVPMAMLSDTELSIASFMYLIMVCASLTITCYCNIKIYHLIRSKGRKVNNFPANKTDKDEIKQSTERVAQLKNNAIVIAIITLLFVLCYVPFIVCTTIKQLRILVNEKLGVLLNFWTVFLVLLNSFMNPVVYYFRMQSIRKAFKKLFCKSRLQVEDE